MTMLFRLEYNCLTLCKNNPDDLDELEYTLKNHIGNPSIKEYIAENDVDLAHDSLLFQSGLQANNPYLLVCITMYNESPIQLLQTIAGVYRSLYEILDWKSEHENKIQLVIIIDGYDTIPDDKDDDEYHKYLKFYEKVGIYNAF